MAPRTTYEKILADHLIGDDLLFIDLHLVHEVTSPQAFEGLRLANRRVRRPDRTLATADHNVPTWELSRPIDDDMSRQQLEALDRNCEDFGIRLYGRGHRRQGIVHVIGPELGVTQPGMTIVCGDSHTSTHGALGALAFGIGTSEVEQVLATQTLPHKRGPQMLVRFEGMPVPRRHGEGPDPRADRTDRHRRRDRPRGRVRRRGDPRALDGGPADRLQHVDRGRRTRGPDRAGRDHVRLPRGSAGRAGAVGAGARPLGGLPHGRRAPASTARSSSTSRRSRPRSAGARTRARSRRSPGRVPEPRDDTDARALEYMGLEAGTAIADVAIDRVFIGSCTNGRLPDLRAAADVVRGKKVAAGVRAMVVPGSMAVKAAAEAEGLDKVFADAGFEWRNAGCSMCLGMNPDILGAGERCASTSNRNFEGRQGAGGRTHLVSPEMAAAAAVTGHLVDVREL